MFSDKFVFSGHTSYNGFVINYENKKVKESVSTKDYSMDVPKSSKEKGKEFDKLLIMIMPIVFIVFCILKISLNYFIGWHLMPSWWQFIFIFILAFIFSPLSILRFRDQDFKRSNQWHACEHKLCHLLDKRKKVTIESLKKARKVDVACGTTIPLMILTVTILYTFLYGTGDPSPEVSRNAVEISQIVSTVIYLIAMVINILIHLGISLLMQGILFLQEPTAEQYKETLRLGEIIEKKIKDIESIVFNQ